MAPRAPKAETADADEVPERRPILEALRAAPEKIGLQAKLTSVLADVRRIPKLGRNTAQNYDFAREGDIADMIRDSLSAHRVAFSASFREREGGDLAVVYNVIHSRAGGAGVECIVDVDITLTCGDTGEERISRWQGVATDYTDKALMKALTAAKKSYLVFTFLVSTGEEEADGSGIERERQGGQRQQSGGGQAQAQQQAAKPSAEQTKAGRLADGSPDQAKSSEPQRRRLFGISKDSMFLTTQTEKGRKVNDTALHNLVAWVTRKPDVDPAGPVTSLTNLTKWQMARVYKVIEDTNADAELAGQVAAAIDEWLEGNQADGSAATGEESQAEPEPKEAESPAAEPKDAAGTLGDDADGVERNPGSSEHDAAIPFGDDDKKEASGDESD